VEARGGGVARVIQREAKLSSEMDGKKRPIDQRRR